MLATVAADSGSRQHRVGEGHLGPTKDSVNNLFAARSDNFAKTAKYRGLRALWVRRVHGYWRYITTAAIRVLANPSVLHREIRA